MLPRIVELILLGFLLWLAFEGVKARVRAFFSVDPPAARRRESPRRPVETLARCASCGTHFPHAQAFPGRDIGTVYCCERCRKAGDR